MMGMVKGMGVALGLVLAFLLAMGRPAGGRAMAVDGRQEPSAPSSLHSPAVTTVKIYLIAIGDSGKSGRKIGCGDSLVAVTRPIPATRGPLVAALRLLVSDHRRTYGESGLYNALYQSRLSVRRAVVVNGKATVQLGGRMQLGGECDNPRAVAQIRQTVRQFRSVRTAVITINGRPLSSWLSEK